MSITKTREVFSLPNVHYAKISKYLWYKDLEVSTILYTFVPKKREQLCFQKVVRMVVIKRSKYCYKNATLLICQN